MRITSSMNASAPRLVVAASVTAPNAVAGGLGVVLPFARLIPVARMMQSPLKGAGSSEFNSLKRQSQSKSNVSGRLRRTGRNYRAVFGERERK